MISAEELKELPIIIKGDVAGSVEALADQFMELNTSEVQVRIVHKRGGRGQRVGRAAGGEHRRHDHRLPHAAGRGDHASWPSSTT